MIDSFYYHWHPKLLDVGNIIDPTYGDLINKIDKVSQPDKYTLEMEFDKYRMANYPDKPIEAEISIFIQNTGLCLAI